MEPISNKIFIPDASNCSSDGGSGKLFPDDIAEYVYKLTSLYNKFYAENKVLVEEDKELQESWLVLTKLVYDINNVLLDVLGLKVPEKM